MLSCYMRHSLIFSVLTYFRYISDVSKTGSKYQPQFKSTHFKPYAFKEIASLPAGTPFSVQSLQVPEIYPSTIEVNMCLYAL